MAQDCIGVETLILHGPCQGDTKGPGAGRLSHAKPPTTQEPTVANVTIYHNPN